MRRISTLTVLSLLTVGCGLVDLPVGDPLDVVPEPVTPGKDEPVDVPEMPSDEPDEDEVETPPAVQVPFHGLTCNEEGPATWNADDLCGPEAPGCDLVVFTSQCDLFPGGSPSVCLARDADGTWTGCVDAMLTRLSEEETARILNEPDLVWLAVQKAYGFVQGPRLSMERDVSRCLDDERTDTADEVEAEPWGLYFRHGGLEHETCAAGEFEGVWGGGPGLGSVRAPVIDSCEASLLEAGWQVDREDDGLWLTTRSFSVRRVVAGLVDDLDLR